MDAKYYTLMMIISNQDILKIKVRNLWRQNLSRRIFLTCNGSGKLSPLMALLQVHLKHSSITTMSVFKF